MQTDFINSRLLKSLPIVIAAFVLFSIGAASGKTDPGLGWIGLVVEDLANDTIASRREALIGGVRIARVVRGSPAEASGFKVNDVIRAIDSKAIETRQAYESEIGKLRSGSTANIHYTRGRSFMSVQVQLGLPPEDTSSKTLPLPNPIVQVESGGHQSRVTELRFFSDGMRLLSASDDKVVRLWDLERQRQIRAFRGHHLDGQDGKIYALDLSPDEKSFASSGFLFDKDKNGAKKALIRIVDLATGATLRILSGHINTVNSVAFSPDGSLLASGGADGQVLIWDLHSGNLRVRLSNHELLSVEDVAFSASGDVILSRDESGGLKAWSLASNSAISIFDILSKNVTAVACARDSDIVAVGTADGLVQTIRLEDGKVVQKFVSPQARAIGRVSISSKGESIFFSYGDIEKRTFSIHHLDVARGQLREIPTQYDRRPLALAVSNDGVLIAASGELDRSINIYTQPTSERSDGNKKLRQSYELRARTAPVYVVSFDNSGTRIGWGYTDRGSHNSQLEPIEYWLQLPLSGKGLGSPKATSGEPSDYYRAKMEVNSTKLKAVRGGPYNRQYGRLIVSERGHEIRSIIRSSHNGYGHTAYSLFNRNTNIISGGQGGFLETYDSSSKHLKTFKGHTDVVWSVSVSPDDRFIISSGSDQTIRLWNAKSGELIVSLLRSLDGEWVTWLPQGFYYGSGGGSQLIGWQLNNGPTRTPDFTTSEQYRRILNRRDLIRRAIELGSARRAVEEAFPAGFSLSKLLVALPPQIRLASSHKLPVQTEGTARIVGFIKSEDADLKEVFAYVRGSKVKLSPSPILSNDPRPPEGWLIYAYHVPLYKGDNTVELVAVNDIGASARGSAVANIKQIGEAPLDERGVLRIIAIGVNDYPGIGERCGKDGKSSCDLKLASKDAERFAHAISNNAAKRYQRVETTILSNSGKYQNPTRDNIISALDMLARADPRDTSLVFLAGHGEKGPNGSYYFLPTDIVRDRSAGSGQGQKLIGWIEIQERLSDVAGRRVLFVDTCRAASVDAWRAHNDRLANDAHSENFAAFVGSGRDQPALEYPRLGHGLFTYAILEAINKEESWTSRFPSSKSVRVYSLGDFVAERVRILSQGRQEPEVHVGVGDFVLVWHQ